MQCSGEAFGSSLTSIASPRTGVGWLWLTSRALAMTLLGTTAMLPVAICVERRFTCSTWLSIPPSTHKRSPVL